METNLRLCGLIVIVTAIRKLQQSYSFLVIGKDFMIDKLSVFFVCLLIALSCEKLPRHDSMPGELELLARTTANLEVRYFLGTGSSKLVCTACLGAASQQDLSP